MYKRKMSKHKEPIPFMEVPKMKKGRRKSKEMSQKTFSLRSAAKMT